MLNMLVNSLMFHQSDDVREVMFECQISEYITQHWTPSLSHWDASYKDKLSVVCVMFCWSQSSILRA